MMLDEAFELYSTAVDEAVMVYDILSPDAQTLVSNLYGKILELKEKIDAKTTEDEAKAAVRAEVNAFQQKWLKVFTLNSGNVTAYDRTAIEMALADYENLSAEAKESLTARITMLKNLLTVIEGIEKPDDGGNGNSGGDGETPGTSDGGKTTVVEKEVLVTVKEFISRNMSKIVWVLFVLLAAAVASLLFPLIMTIRYKKRNESTNPSQNNEGKEE